VWGKNNARNVCGDLIEGDVEEYKPCLYGKTLFIENNVPGSVHASGQSTHL
jgi:hypothetical protein